MSFRVGSGESNQGGALLPETLGRIAEGLGVVLPGPKDRSTKATAAYDVAELGRRVRVHPTDQQRRAFWVCLQSDRVRLAGGWTTDLAEVVRAAEA